MAMKARHPRAGFTLVELMVAMLAGAFAVGGVYYLNGVSSRTFNEQMRISETQMSLRSAMEQLRRELTRAGYLFTPSSWTNRDCGGSLAANGTGPSGTDAIAPRALQALSVTGDGSLAAVNAVLGAATNPTRADQVDVWGNFATSDAYLANPIGTSATNIRFQIDSESFRRSFFNRSTNAIDGDRFAEAFAVGRMVRIENDGRVFFRDITGVNKTTFDVTINALPWCFEATRWVAISPVVHYRYRLELDTASDLARLRPNTAAIGSSRALLVRREWRANAAGTGEEVVENSAKVMLDNAVEFAADALVDANIDIAPPPETPTVGITPAFRLVRGANLTTQSTDRPWAFRSLIVTLSARSAEADPRLPTMTRTPFGDAALLDGPMLTFRLVGTGVPAGSALNARVRTMRAEIFLQNL